ncbi:MAG: hypothetical protein ACK47B_04930 [Armatimonadota bacterium]
MTSTRLRCFFTELCQVALGVTLCAAVLAGCGGGRSNPAVNGPARLPEAPQAPTITATSAGPLRLGMPAEEVQRLPNYTVDRLTQKLEGFSTPALRVAQFGTNQALVELQNEQAWRIAVLTETWRTAEGARVGMTAAELEKIYGPGTVAAGEGNVCALFERAPGLSFCFEAADELQGLGSGDWANLRERNPRVRRILVVGE